MLFTVLDMFCLDLVVHCLFLSPSASYLMLLMIVCLQGTSDILDISDLVLPGMMRKSANNQTL